MASLSTFHLLFLFVTAYLHNDTIARLCLLCRYIYECYYNSLLLNLYSRMWRGGGRTSENFAYFRRYIYKHKRNSFIHYTPNKKSQWKLGQERPGKSWNLCRISLIVFTPHATSNHHNNEIARSLDTPCQMSLPIETFSPKEVQQQIKTVNHRKAPGYDAITGKILQTKQSYCLQQSSIVCSDYLISQRHGNSLKLSWYQSLVSQLTK
jgi:hypothetical protein